MTEKDFTFGSARRMARQLVDLTDFKRKKILGSFPSDLRCRIVEEMVSIRLQRLRNDQGVIGIPVMKESER